MEILSARMAPAFKGEDSWKHKRVYDNKNSRQSESKLEHRLDRAVNYEAAPLRESGHKKLYPGGGNSLEGGNRPSIARSLGRLHPESGSFPTSYQRRLETPEDSTDEAETSQDIHPDDSDNSGDEDPADTPALEAPQKWPIIQIVDPPAWLPEGWTAVLRTRESGSKDKYYVDPVSQRRFRSKTEVNYFLQTGKSYRYKRNLALLTKPLKEDPASLPNSVPARNGAVDMTSSRESVQTFPFMSPSAYGGESRNTAAAPSRSAQAPDLRLSIMPPQAEQPRKPYNKPGPKPKIKVFPEDPGRSFLATAPKRNLLEERKAPEGSHGQVAENRGKLILKLKRKTAELDEGQRNGKKPRPFEVVGGTAALKSRSTSSDEEVGHQKNHWAVDHAVDSSSRVPHTMVPSNLVSRKPLTKAPPAAWQYQPQSSSYSRPQYGGTANLINSSNGQGHTLERTSGSVTLSITDSENPKLPLKRESPAEQLQRLGRRLCQQAAAILMSERGGSNTLQQVSSALHAAMNPVHNSGYNAAFNSILTPSFNSALHAPSPYQHQQRPIKRMRGSLPKEKTIVPMQKYGLDQHYALVPQAQ